MSMRGAREAFPCLNPSPVGPPTDMADGGSPAPGRALPVKLERPRELLVSGHVNVDRFLKVAAFPDADRTVPLLADRRLLGGTATNVALSASGYGVAAGIVSHIGASFPPEFRAALERAGIDLRGLRTHGANTPTCFIIEDLRGRQRTLIDQGPMGDLRRAALPGGWMREYSWLHLTTGDPAYQLRLARRARALGLKVAADPAQEIHYRWHRTSFRQLLGLAELLFGNRRELERAARFLGVRDPAALADHVPLVVRTEGRQGATAFSRTGAVHVPAHRPRTVATAVGAGDAFRGGFYSAWFGGQTLEDCLRAGTRASSHWIEDRSEGTKR